MQQVIDFETELAKITTPSDERRDEEKLYHSMSISELQNLAPFVGFLFLVRSALIHCCFCARFLG
jgi:predicted metalloendopeptidase